MHAVQRAYRRIADAELPQTRDIATGELRPCTDQELADMDIIHVADDIYLCAEQLRRDPDTLEWAHHDTPKPGAVLSQGDLRERHVGLSAPVRGRVMRARVIRSPDPAVNALEVAEANLVEQAAAIEEFVGAVEAVEGVGAATRPLVDFDSASVLLEEGRRLAAAPDNDIACVTVCMDEIDAGGDIVEADYLIPMAFAGERIL